MAKRRVGSPVGVALVAAVLAALLTTLVLSFVLDDDADTAESDVTHLTLAPTGDSVPQADTEGEAAPDFSFADIRTGDEQTLDEFRDGKPAVVNFFFRTCAPCVVEMPDLQDAYEEYGDEVAFLGLSYQETAESGLELVERTGVTYDIGRDPDGSIITEFEAPGLPTTVFIAADGTITYSHTRKISPDQLREQLDRLVGVIDAPLALAFSAGMVATVNPCGFAMLPAYLTFFLGLDGGEADADTRAGVTRALAVGAAVTLGFIAVFTTIGALISHASLAVDELFPWMTIVVGIAVFGLGIALLTGFELQLALPHLDRGGRARTLRSMFVFGVSYAIASLSCTLPVFLSVVAGTFSRTNATSGIAMYVVFAAGMGLVLTVLTLALALARVSIVHRLRSLLPVINRVSGGLLVLAGAYFTWYGIYELRIQDDPRAEAGPVDLVTGWSSDISGWIQDVGPTRLGLVLGIVVCVALLYVLLRPVDEADVSEDEPARAG